MPCESLHSKIFQSRNTTGHSAFCPKTVLTDLEMLNGCISFNKLKVESPRSAGGLMVYVCFCA